MKHAYFKIGCQVPPATKWSKYTKCHRDKLCRSLGYYLRLSFSVVNYADRSGNGSFFEKV
uniref:Uncharacterized protein n=1 Tax=Anguilla anguilla TaxID=7936 RepID=A0A0E9PTJ0_ANGAN